MISTNKIEVEDKTEIKKGEIVLFYFEETVSLFSRVAVLVYIPTSARMI